MLAVAVAAKYIREGGCNPLYRDKNSFEHIRFSGNHPAFFSHVVPADPIAGSGIRIRELDSYSLTASRHPGPHLRPFPLRSAHTERPGVSLPD